MAVAKKTRLLPKLSHFKRGGEEREKNLPEARREEIEKFCAVVQFNPALVALPVLPAGVTRISDSCLDMQI